MKKLFTILAAVMTLITIGSCKSEKQQDTAAEVAQAPKALVLYYSQTGTTKAVAEEIQKALDADIEAIEAEEPYGGTYDETIGRCMAEMQSQTVPAVKPIRSDLSQYDVIFLGYPIWFGTYARPILGLIAAYDFDGKKVVPFCTFGSGGIEASAADLKAALPKAEIADGYGVRTARIAAAPKEVAAFLAANGYVDAEVESLPDFSEQQPVTPEEAAIFDAACGSYMFPLGTPVTCGKRTVADGTEYVFTAASKDQQGNDTQSTIYVIASNQEGAVPEFTRVVR